MEKTKMGQGQKGNYGFFNHVYRLMINMATFV